MPQAWLLRVCETVCETQREGERQRWRDRDPQIEVYKVTEGESQRLIYKVKQRPMAQRSALVTGRTGGITEVVTS